MYNIKYDFKNLDFIISKTRLPQRDFRLNYRYLTNAPFLENCKQ